MKQHDATSVTRVTEAITQLSRTLREVPPEDQDLVANLVDGFATATLMRGDVGSEDAAGLAADRLRACAAVFRHEAEARRRAATDVRARINALLDEHDGGAA